ncbi:hypothetical protein KY342_03175 [Candidatus Woesearchaeota archaeon]|nr:hypothetical protein [Candidatus Woesearchaeota archaeon]
MFEMLKFRKAQLGIIEAKFLFIGIIIGIIIGIAVVILAARGIIPLGFVKSLVCGAAAKK